MQTQQLRDTGGRFAGSVHSAPELGLSEDGFTPAPLGEDDIDYATRGACGLVAMQLSEATGWPVVVLTTSDHQLWVHAAVRTPSGMVIDASGASAGGQHILDDDVFYGSFEEDELALSDGEVWLADVPAGVAIEDRTEDRADRIAGQLQAWAIKQGF